MSQNYVRTIEGEWLPAQPIRPSWGTRLLMRLDRLRLGRQVQRAAAAVLVIAGLLVVGLLAGCAPEKPCRHWTYVPQVHLIPVGKSLIPVTTVVPLCDAY